MSKKEHSMAKPDNDQEIYGAPLDLPEESLDSSTHHQKPSNTFRYKRFFAITAVLVIASVCIYVLLLRPKPSAPAKTNQNYSTTKPSEDSRDSGVTTNLKKYNGDFPRMELNYPATWTLTEKDNGVTISSPEFTYMTINKGEINGNFIVYIRQGAREQEGTYIGRGLAVRPTEKLVYKAPSSTQRADTNLTLFGLDSSDYFSYFFITGDYELKKGETLGPSYGREADTYIITGGYGTDKQSNPMDFNNLEIKKATSENVYKLGIEIVKSIKVY